MVFKALAIAVLTSASPAALAQQGQCDTAAFREAVASASATITALHEKKGKAFQEGLQKLRRLNNWQESEYVAKAAQYVKDDATAFFDTENRPCWQRCNLWMPPVRIPRLGAVQCSVK